MSLKPLLPCFRDADRGQRNLDSIGVLLGTDTAATVGPVLLRAVPLLADADMAVNNLDRLVRDPVAAEQLRVVLGQEPDRLEPLLHLLATSQFFADTLCAYPDAVDLVDVLPRRNPSTSELTDTLRRDVDAAHDDAGVLRAFRRFRHLQMLRIGVNDVLRDRPLDEITRDLARVADASVEVALTTAIRSVGRKYGRPATARNGPSRIAAFAFGKLGGDELNYSSDIDLMLIYDVEGQTEGGRATRTTNAQFYARVVTELIRYLSSHAEGGFAYRVDLRLRPEGNRGPLARSLASTLSYYDVMGRTWERQALIKVRHCAGDSDLGHEFLTAIEPFVYRKYFSFSEINEVKALKRQMEKRSLVSGGDDQDVKTGWGGIRDIEYTVQFLQLLNGGDLPAVRQRNTLLALEALEIGGCLTAQETYILADAYRFLRKVEHRLQLLFDWQTHKLPTSEPELLKLARRMGYDEVRTETPPPRADSSSVPPTRVPQKRSPLDEKPESGLDTRNLLVDPLERFLKDYHDKTRLDRTILDHLLHMAFAETDGQSEPETDLILLPEPDEDTVRTVLSRHRFHDIRAAYQSLSNLAREAVPFLSHRRCRHFLASIAPRLLRNIAETADPDQTLNTLDRVTASLGAKAVLYELFSFNPASLKLYVDLCANSPYLSGILTNNPGMIDELLDSLLLDQPRSREELAQELAELLRGAHDPDPILHSFQDKELLRIGVRDLLGRDTVRETTAALSDLAETLLNAVFDLTEPTVQQKLALPQVATVDGTTTPARYAIIGLGKLGGREISYHSDLDLLLIYETDCDGEIGEGAAPGKGAARTARYFTELAQHVIRRTTESGPLGRLYEVDMRLRPTGKSGSLAVSLAEFERYFSRGSGETWERLSLTRARVIHGDAVFANRVMDQIRTIVTMPQGDRLLDDVREMRSRLEVSAKSGSLKRGVGGLVDVEFVVQMLQLAHAARYPKILEPNIWAAIDLLKSVRLLDRESANSLRDGYTFLRRVECGLRLMSDHAPGEIPDAASERAKLARRLEFGEDNGAGDLQQFENRLATVRTRLREVFDRQTRGGT